MVQIPAELWVVMKAVMKVEWMDVRTAGKLDKRLGDILGS